MAISHVGCMTLQVQGRYVAERRGDQQQGWIATFSSSSVASQDSEHAVGPCEPRWLSGTHLMF